MVSMNNGNAQVVAVRGLSRNFGKKAALNEVSLHVEPGQVYGLLGENGAGKTTLISHLLGAFEPEAGSVRVFGLDPVADPVGVLSRVGYLSEDRDLPLWMRVDELLAYTAAFYPAWDRAYVERLRQEFGLPSEAKIKHLSRGEKARAGLLVALGHRPDLLLLDEPSSGLDVVARRDILAEVVRSVAEEGRTVIFSSHLLEEVERVADQIAILHQGRIVLDLPMDTLKSTHHRFIVRFASPVEAFPAVPGVLQAEGENKEWLVVARGEREELARALLETGGVLVEQGGASLETIFVSYATGADVRAMHANGEEAA